MQYLFIIIFVLFIFLPIKVKGEENPQILSDLNLGQDVPSSQLIRQHKEISSVYNADSWQNFRNRLSGDVIINIPAGLIMPSNPRDYSIQAPQSPNPTDNNIFYFSQKSINILGGYGRNSIDSDNDTTISPYNGSIYIGKHTKKALNSRPIFNISYENSSENIKSYGGGGMYSKLPPVSINLYQDPNAYGSLTGISFWLLDQSKGEKAPLLNQSQIFDGTLIRDGRSSTWGFSLSQRDTTGQAPQGFAETFAELDGSANGLDGGNPIFSPGDGDRKGIWIQSGSENFYVSGVGKNSNLVENHKWAPLSNFKQNDRIRVIASDGRFHLYAALNFGTTGVNIAQWPVSASSIILDGSMKWRHLGLFNAGFSKAIFIDGNNYFHMGDSWFDVGLTSNNNFSGAFIDTSQVRFIDPQKSFTLQTNLDGSPIPDGHGSFKYNYVASPYGAALRMGANQNIDFSADGTLNGLNKRRIYYSSEDSSLEYRNPQGSIVKISDGGNFNINGLFSLSKLFNYKANLEEVKKNSTLIIGSGLWGSNENDTDILGTERNLLLGVINQKNKSLPNNPAIKITEKNTVIFGEIIQISSMSKKNILKISSPQEGMIVNDGDNHMPVIYEKGKWYPIILGRPLSL